MNVLILFKSKVKEKINFQYPLLSPIVDSLIERCKMSSVEKSFFKNVIDNLSTAGRLNPDNSAMSWKNLPTIPDDKELLGDLMEADQSLPHVKVNEPYLTGNGMLRHRFSVFF